MKAVYRVIDGKVLRFTLPYSGVREIPTTTKEEGEVVYIAQNKIHRTRPTGTYLVVPLEEIPKEDLK